MNCTLCPRACGAQRTNQHTAGFCHSTHTAKVTRAAPHFWEEPCISGTKGSGTVFFAGCNLGCIYCQNHAISQSGTQGKSVTPKQLQQIFKMLEAQGVHNINLVTPTHFAPVIQEALAKPPSLPVIYNCGGYESLHTIRQFQGIIPIYLPDMKYALEQPAAEFSHAPDYPQVAKAAILEMFNQVGPYTLDEQGILQSGVLIRHMILPGNTANTLAVIDWVANTFQKGDVLFSLMSQYTPTPLVANHKTLHRPITKREFEKCRNALWEAGIDEGFIQDPDSVGEQFIPSFDQTGLDF